MTMSYYFISKLHTWQSPLYHLIFLESSQIILVLYYNIKFLIVFESEFVHMVGYMYAFVNKS